MTDPFMRILSTQSWVEGEIVKARLETEGIPIQIKGPHEGPYPVGPVDLFVPSSFETRARSILAEIESGSYELADGEAPDSATGHED